MTSTRRTAVIAGVCYLLTFVSIPTLTLYGPIKSAGHILQAGSDTPALWGALLEVIVALTSVGTAVALYPVIRRQNQAMALGFVASRTLEAAMILTGVVSILTLVSLRGSTSAAGSDVLALTEHTLITNYNGAFLLGQSLMPAVNAVLLGSLLLRSGLVNRAIALIGLIGAPIHLTAVLLTLFGVIDRISPITLIAALPIAVWEFSLGCYLVIKGFRPVPATAAPVGSGGDTPIPAGIPTGSAV